LQDKYGKTGKFQIILSHVQPYDKKIIDGILGKNKVTFPSYQQVRLKSAPCDGLPTMVLFDHDGNIVEKGYLRDLDSKVKGLVKAAPNPADYSPLYETVDVKHNKREVTGLKLGRSIKSALMSLERKAAKKDAAGEEASAIIKAVNTWGEKELSEATTLLESAPTTAYARLNILNKTFYSMPLVKELPRKLSSLMKDKYFKYLVGLSSQLERLKTSKKITQRSKDSLIRSYQGFIDKYPASEALKSEAASIIEQINAIALK
jgi:hypothetical protein